MSDHNPYAPPKAEVRDAPSQPIGGLASRGLRLTAAIVDSVIAMFVTVPVLLFSGYMQKALAGDPGTFVERLGFSAIAVVAFVVIHGVWLAKYGQTVGKRVVGIRIVNVSDGRIPKLWTMLGLRYGVMWLVSLVPGIGFVISLVDDLLVFRSDRRCLHDLIAGTRVVVSEAIDAIDA